MKTRTLSTTSTTAITMTLTTQSIISDSLPTRLALAPLNVILKATDHAELNTNETIHASLSGTGQIKKYENKRKEKVINLTFHLDQPGQNNSPHCFAKYMDGNLTISKIDKDHHQAELKGKFDIGGILKNKMEKRKISYYQSKDEDTHTKTMMSEFTIPAYGVSTLFKIKVEKPMKLRTHEGDMDLQQQGKLI